MVEQTLSPSRQVAISRRFCCVEDIDLLQQLVSLYQPDVTVIIGAGSGTMSLGWLEVRQEGQRLISVDISQENLDWERKAWVAGNWGKWPPDVYQWLGDSKKMEAKTTPIDLLVIDGDHSEEGVRGDLLNWLPYMSNASVIMLHDYDATNAPEFSPGVKIAADELLTPDKWEFMGKEGWSAWWRRK